VSNFWSLLFTAITCWIVVAVVPLSQAQSNNPCVGPCVLTYHYDLARDGVQNNETVLTPAKIKAVGAFGKVGSITGLHGQIYAQPLYVSGLNSVSSKGNVVLVATQQDYVYAFDADSYTMIWGSSYIPAAEGAITTGASGNISCTDISPNQGITSTPVIDPHTTFNANPTIYFTTESVDSSSNIHQRLHAVDVTTGAELYGGPVEITTPAGSTVPFVPSLQLQRSSLALTYDGSNNPQIYISWGSNCDQGAYHGWVMKYTVTQGQLSATPAGYFVTTPTGVEGGVWGSGAGLAADNSVNGNLYIASGNGTADDTSNFGQSVLKFSSSLGLLDWYTPNNSKCLNGIKKDSYCPGNEDLGSGGTVLFNVPGGVPELATVGKEGEVYVNYQASLGHLDPAAPNPNYAPPATCTSGPLGGGPNNIAQCFQGLVPFQGAGTGPAVAGGYGTPAFWNNTVYTVGAHDTLRAYQLSSTNVGTFNTTGAAATTTTNFPWPGASPAISWNGTDPSTGIVWVQQTAGYQLGNPAVLTAYTAVPNGSALTYLYNTGSTGPIAVKFGVTTVANGKVFVAGQGFTGTEGRLYIYGLCPCTGPTLKSASPNTGSIAGGTTVTLSGTGFQSGAMVTFGGTAATNVTVVSSTQITAITPAHATGAVTVTITNPDGQSATIPAGSFTFVTTITFAQVGPASAISVSMAYSNPQLAGDLNVVIVGWNDAVSTITSVTDTAGNVYQPAAAVLRTGSGNGGSALSQAIYYASGIAGGANTITVAFNQAATSVDIRILEYGGVSTLDQSTGQSGTGSTSSCGPVNTTSANEVIVAGNVSTSVTTGPGPGFTSRIITKADGNIAEDEFLSTAGSYGASASLSATATWIMQMATFK
jgi:hypothetical protein